MSVHPDEAARLAALRRYEVLDTPPDEAFDRIARLASHVLGTPIAVVSLVDDTRQWFKAVVGLGVRETPREVSFCAHAIASAEVLVVNDARLDPRFADNPLVTGDPRVRFYAGAPLVTSDGHALGTLCVLDRQPRGLADADRAVLVDLAALVVDALETRRMALELRRAQQRTAAILDSLAEGVIVADPDGTYSVMNVAARRLLGLRATEPRRLQDGSGLRTEAGTPLALVDTPLARALRGEDTNALGVSVCVHGAWRHFSVSARAVRAADGAVEAAVSTFVDVTEALRVERQLRQRAECDGLTGLFNRAALDVHLESVERSAAVALTVIMVDVDHFKRLNDTLGHVEGDRALTVVAAAIRANLRETDFVARYGGEEFCVVLSGLSELDALRVAEKLRATIEATGRVTASLGLCRASTSQLAPREVLVLADRALLDAKVAGRNRVAMRSPPPLAAP
jgi:diguanylate cyclase (GGDEF)-like protein/PAS domain S-box-containing protein